MGNAISASETTVVRGGQGNSIKVAPSTLTYIENISILQNEVPDKGLDIYNNTNCNINIIFSKKFKIYLFVHFRNLCVDFFSLVFRDVWWKLSFITRP